MNLVTLRRMMWIFSISPIDWVHDSPSLVATHALQVLMHLVNPPSSLRFKLFVPTGFEASVVFTWSTCPALHIHPILAPCCAQLCLPACAVVTIILVKEYATVSNFLRIIFVLPAKQTNLLDLGIFFLHC